MGEFIVHGGAPLFGKVCVSGSKNGALPLIFASLITKGVSVINNLPDIGDINTALEIIKQLGASVKRLGSRLYIDTESLEYRIPDPTLVGRLRASTYLLGASLARFGRAELAVFGGCNFSPRPIDMHIDVMLSHGAKREGDVFIAEGLEPSDISLRLPSVGATVNALIMAAACRGRSIIRGIALEPHIKTLISYLTSAGAEIDITGDVATVVGGELSGGSVTVEGDMIEAGSYIAAAIVTGGAVRVRGACPRDLYSFLEPLARSGVTVNLDDGIFVTGKPRERISLPTSPYPGFPTDLQPIMAPVLSIFGGSLTENVWRERFGYLKALSRFGISYRLLDNTAELFPSEPRPATASAPDLRGGAALLLAALSADGESRISSGEIVLRGYERLTEKLTALGAEIEYRE